MGFNKPPGTEIFICSLIFIIHLHRGHIACCASPPRDGGLGAARAVFRRGRFDKNQSSLGGWLVSFIKSGVSLPCVSFFLSSTTGSISQTAVPLHCNLYNPLSSARHNLQNPELDGE